QLLDLRGLGAVPGRGGREDLATGGHGRARRERDGREPPRPRCRPRGVGGDRRSAADRLVTPVDEENVPSRRAVEKVGFREFARTVITRRLTTELRVDSLGGDA